MTSFNTFAERNRDMQDGVERHVFKSIEHVNGAGAVVSVDGTGTSDQEAPVVNTGYGFTPPAGTNMEVLLLSGGSDTTQKLAIMTIPNDKQRQWPEGRGGVQNPLDASHALEFRDGRLHLTKGIFTVGDAGTLEVRDGQIYIRGNVTVTGTLTANGGVITPNVSAGSDGSVPGATP